MLPNLNPYEVFKIQANDPCFCGSGTMFRFCCYRISDTIMNALSMADRKKYKSALKLLEKAEAAPGSAEVHGIRAQVLAMMQNYEAADREIELALTINANYPRAYFIKGNNLFEEEEFEQALGMYDKALELYPPLCVVHKGEVFASKGYCYFMMNDYASAKQTWRQGLETNPEDFVIPSLMREYLYDNAGVPETISKKDEFYYSRVAPLAADDSLIDELDEDLTEDDEYDYLNELEADTIRKLDKLMDKASNQIEDGESEKAIKTLEKALDIYPYQPNILMTLFGLYVDIGSMEEAVDCLYELLEFTKNPHNIIAALSNITSFKIISAVSNCFPLLLHDKLDGGKTHFQTFRLNLSDAGKAIGLLEKSPLLMNRTEKENAVEFAFSERPLARKDKDACFFYVRVYPDAKFAYFDTLFEEKSGEFLNIAIGMMDGTVTGEPDGPTFSTIYVPDINEMILSYEEDPILDADDDEGGELPEFEIITEQECRKLVEELMVGFFEEFWLNTPAPGLAGLSPLDAIEDEKFAPLLPEIVGIVEESVVKVFGEKTPVYDFNRLRKALAL